MTTRNYALQLRHIPRQDLAYVPHGPASTPQLPIDPFQCFQSRAFEVNNATSKLMPYMIVMRQEISMHNADLVRGRSGAFTSLDGIAQRFLKLADPSVKGLLFST